MLRATLALSVWTGVLAFADHAFACGPSAPLFVAPTAILTDMSRPLARDAGIRFSGEARTAGWPGDSVFAVEVTDTRTGQLVPGELESFGPYNDADTLVWLPEQPWAAGGMFEVRVKPLPTMPVVPPQMPIEPVDELRATFTTAQGLLSALEIDGTVDVSMRIETRRPFRCEGPCGLMTGPCEPVPVLLADLDLPAVVGGAGEDGYLVELRLSWPASADDYERSYFKLISVQSPKRVTVEVMEVPRAVELCVQMTARDLARHTTSAAPACVDAAVVAAAIEASDPVPAAGTSSSPAAMQAGTSAPQPLGTAAPAPMANESSARHVEACSVGAPGAAHKAWPSVLVLAFPLFARRRRRQ